MLSSLISLHRLLCFSATILYFVAEAYKLSTLSLRSSDHSVNLKIASYVPLEVRGTYNKRRVRKASPTLLYSTDGNSEDVKIKLPVIQVFDGAEISAEFVCGDDLPGSVKKFQSFMQTKKALSPPSSSPSSASFPPQETGGVIDYVQWPIDNIYSDESIEGLLQDPKRMKVVKLYRNGCKKCLKLEPFYHDIASREEFRHIYWTQSNVDHVPVYVKRTKERLSGALNLKPSSSGDESSNNDAIMNCDLCMNSGFLPCAECSGSGVVKRGEMGVICPVCVGYNRVRCTKCGGKCIKCEG